MRDQDVIDCVGYYLSKLKNGDFDCAFQGLIDVGDSVIPHLINAFHLETDPSIRAELVRIVWQYRRQESLAFLGEALRDPHPNVWKSALDGLVTIGTKSALKTLLAGLTRSFQNKQEADIFKKWVDEAIEQVQIQISENN